MGPFRYRPSVFRVSEPFSVWEESTVERRQFMGVAGLSFLGAVSLPVCARADDTEGGWRTCKKCQGLWFAEGGEKRPGKCPDGGAHDATDSEKFALLIVESKEAQVGWRRCQKCEGLWYAAGGDKRQGKCPDGKTHDETGSEKYFIIQNNANAAGRDNWRWCMKCEGMWYAADEKKEGKCPAGGGHSKQGSGNYVLPKG